MLYCRHILMEDFFFIWLTFSLPQTTRKWDECMCIRLAVGLILTYGDIQESERVRELVCICERKRVRENMSEWWCAQ
jgi:hypothetical protein